VRGAVEAVMRKEGIYNSHLWAWRQQIRKRGPQGLASRQPGRKPTHEEKDRQLAAAQKKVVELERKLLMAKALIDLQKKAHEVLGIALPETDEMI
jgi:transposase